MRRSSTARRKPIHASPTPITDGKRLFVHFGHQGTACLDLEGKILWRNNSTGVVLFSGTLKKGDIEKFKGKDIWMSLGAPADCNLAVEWLVSGPTRYHRELRLERP